MAGGVRLRKACDTCRVRDCGQEQQAAAEGHAGRVALGWVSWRQWAAGGGGPASAPLCPQLRQHHQEPALPHPRQPVLRRPGGPGPAARQLPRGAGHGERLRPASCLPSPPAWAQAGVCGSRKVIPKGTAWPWARWSHAQTPRPAKRVGALSLGRTRGRPTKRGPRRWVPGGQDSSRAHGTLGSPHAPAGPRSPAQPGRSHLCPSWPQVPCQVLATLLHYFFLSAFAWMLVEGLHLYSMVVKVFGSEGSKHLYYYGIGWGRWQAGRGGWPRWAGGWEDG